MGLIDKLKNVFFEEEYVEEEVKEEKNKKEKAPIAKRIELPENKKAKEEEAYNKEDVSEPVLVEINEEKEEAKKENVFKFPMDFEEEDFKDDSSSESKVEVSAATKEMPYNREHEEINRPYENHEFRDSRRVEAQATFKPSPIISPIYGILDRNYKKEEIVAKKEIKLSSMSSKKLDLDSVRQKAYGDLASDITASIMEEEEEKNPVYDLNEESSPAVTKVTVGDAEEYFEDLGLEYNVDYKDSSKNTAKTARRVERKSIMEDYADEEKDTDDEPNDDKEIEDNLFDLIDSMYEDKE